MTAQVLAAPVLNWFLTNVAQEVVEDGPGAWADVIHLGDLIKAPGTAKSELMDRQFLSLPFKKINKS